ncbi:stage II sporulation protein E protein serine/threonine phosphatase [Clostridium sp. CAG:465]|nr:stage II sporulation protein E protein serine/threonine phosphatase [Clostridium sp. CAG:465]
MISNNSYVRTTQNSNEKITGVVNTIKKFVNIKNIIFIILSFAMSNTSFMGDSSPLSLVLFGVASVFNVPLILVLISSIVGILVQSVSMTVLVKLLSFFIIFTLITVIVNIEGVSKRFSVFIKFMISFSAVEVGYNLIQGSLITDLFTCLSNIVVAAILYFVFVSGIYVLTNISKGYVFSKEESIAMVIVVAIALSIFKNITIMQLSIFNILVLILVLIFGWKNGWVAGAATGLVLGLMLTFMSDINMTYVVTLAFSGFISGILSKVGKIGVVIGFIAGNLYIAYYANGFSELTMRVSELVIASVSLLFMPKVFETKLDRIFNKNRSLENPYQNMLDSSTSVKEKIGAMSDVFDSIASVVVDVSDEDKLETREVIKKYIENTVNEKCLGCDRRKNCLNDEKLNLVVDYISNKLENNETIDEKMLDFNCELSKEFVRDIYEIYNSVKLMRILKEQERNNANKLSNQYKEVSKILSNISKNIKSDLIKIDKKQEKLREELKFYGYLVYEDEYKEDDTGIEYTFVTNILNNIDKQKKEIISILSNILEKPMVIKLILNSSKKEKSKIKVVSTPEFNVQNSVISIAKNGEEVSGDSYLIEELQDLKHISVISDGEGNGRNASKSSKNVIDMLERLLSGGFDECGAIEIINSILKLKSDSQNSSTLDNMIIDLKTGYSQYIKLGAAPTYIIHEGKIVTINNMNIPVGVSDNPDYLPISRKLIDKDIVVQISDGVLHEGLDISNNYFTEYLKTIDVNKTAKQITDEIYRNVLRENKNILNDDVTIIVTKIIKNKV